MERVEVAPGVFWIRGYLSPDEQVQMASEILDKAAARGTPFYAPTTAYGKVMSSLQTNQGDLGWVTDVEGGYRYSDKHVLTDQPWPPILPKLLEIWQLGAYPKPPQACLMNLMRGKAKLGMHNDNDEIDLKAPIVSVSLGDTGVFQLGGVTRGGPTQSIHLKSGDVFVMGGPNRMAYHAVARILEGTSSVVPGGGRLSATLRRVTL